MTHFALVSALSLSLAVGVPPSALAKPKAAAVRPLPSGAVEEFATMRDGMKLAGNVYQPGGAGPWPVVMMRTPYLKDGRNDKEKDPDGSKSRAALAKAAKRYTDAGF